LQIKELFVCLSMKKQQEIQTINVESLMEKTAILEKILAEKESALIALNISLNSTTAKLEETNSKLKETKIEQDTTIAKLDAKSFELAQLYRMIYGSKKERFISKTDSKQLSFNFEPETSEIEEPVKEELESIRVSYLRKKTKKQHPGRLQLPSNLPVIETVLEPQEDTTDMVCIGKEVSDELDYTPAKLHINRTIRPIYITKEDETGKQRQVIAELNRPIPKCIASANLLAMIFTEKFRYHLPLYRVLPRITQMGVSIPSSTLE
jgi:transposase